MSYLVVNPEDRFSHDEARIIHVKYCNDPKYLDRQVFLGS